MPGPDARKLVGHGVRLEEAVERPEPADMGRSARRDSWSGRAGGALSVAPSMARLTLSRPSAMMGFWVAADMTPLSSVQFG